MNNLYTDGALLNHAIVVRISACVQCIQRQQIKYLKKMNKTYRTFPNPLCCLANFQFFVRYLISAPGPSGRNQTAKPTPTSLSSRCTTWRGIWTAKSPDASVPDHGRSVTRQCANSPAYSPVGATSRIKVRSRAITSPPTVTTPRVRTCFARCFVRMDWFWLCAHMPQTAVIPFRSDRLAATVNPPPDE